VHFNEYLKIIFEHGGIWMTYFDGVYPELCEGIPVTLTGRGSHCAGYWGDAQKYQMFVHVVYYVHNTCAYRQGNAQNQTDIVQISLLIKSGREVNSCREFLFQPLQI
jgi:hypothetical protein